MKGSIIRRISVACFSAIFLVAVSPLVEVGGYADSSSAYAASKKGKNKKNKKAKIRKNVKNEGLGTLPDASEMLKASNSKSKSQFRTAGLSSNAVSGTPPLLVDIPSSSIKDLFWENGLVDAIINGNPSPNQCNDFFSGNSDGASGGFGACHMAENVGRAFQSILEAGTSLCYMKHFPVQSNVDSGGVSIVLGSLPDGNLEKLFAPPTSSARIVKVTISGEQGEGQNQGGNEDVFLKIHPSTGSTLYHAELWFCRDGTVSGSDDINISKAGKFEVTSNSLNSSGESEIFQSHVEGSLDISGGALTFDSSKPRFATVASQRDNGSFKTSLTISGSKIETKNYDSFGGSLRRGHVITLFSGSGAESVRFLEGAFREAHESQLDSFAGGTEFRSDRYVAAPSSSLISQLMSNEEINQDSFLSSGVNISMDLSSYSCNESADIEISLDMSNAAVRQSVVDCQERPFDNMHFCHDDRDVRLADQGYSNACSGDMN